MRSRGTLWAYTSARTKRNLAFLWTALFLCSLVLQYVSLAAPVAALAASGLKAGTVQGFEIDGDLKSGDGASNPGSIPVALVDSLADGDDWLDGASGSGVVDPAVPPHSDLVSDPAGATNDDQFIGGAKELDTCTWGYDNGPVTGKDDFKHVMAYAKFVSDAAYFYIGAKRIINNGDTHIDFELNRNPWTVFPAGGVAKPDRTVGDLFLSLEFANGGSTPEMTVYKVSAVSDCLRAARRPARPSPSTTSRRRRASIPPRTSSPLPPPASAHRPAVRVRRSGDRPQRARHQPILPRPLVRLRPQPRRRRRQQLAAQGPRRSLPDRPEQLRQALDREARPIPDGSSQSFHFDASYDANGFNLTDGQSHSSGNLEPGTYSVSEDLPEDWTQLSAACDDGSDPSAIHLGANETVTCLFRNRFLPAEVHITKTPDGQTKDAGDSISFQLSWVNSGEGTARGVVVSDDLPDPRGRRVEHLGLHRLRQHLPDGRYEQRPDADLHRRQHGVGRDRQRDAHQRHDEGLVRRHRQHRSHLVDE